MTRLARLALAALITAAPGAALAWGNTGHRIVGEAAVTALPPQLPAFLRTPQAARDVGELSREPDRSKGAGKLHDSDRDPGHFLDLGDDGKVFGGPALEALPPTREDYDTALRAVGQDSWKAGYLPYSIVDRYQQLARDFAFWRVLQAAEANPAWRAHRDFFTADRKRREAQILQAAGQLSHFVGDGSQPLHVTIHFNGWGADLPNPQGFSNARLHAPFEGDLVQANITLAMIQSKVAPLKPVSGSIEKHTADYLAATGRLVVPFYEMEKAGGLAPGDPRGVALASQQIAVGASELRDLIADAWRLSATQTVGWKPVAVADVLAGKVDPYSALYGNRLMSAPQFGDPEPGHAYPDRPAAFAVIARDGLIAVVRVDEPLRVARSGRGEVLDLPGGGVDPGESEQAAAIRECGEEAGLIVALEPAPFVRADHFFVNGKGDRHNTRGAFLAGRVAGEDPALKIEDDHTLVWMAPQAALAGLDRDAHAWAVAAWLRLRR